MKSNLIFFIEKNDFFKVWKLATTTTTATTTDEKSVYFLNFEPNNDTIS